MAYNGQDYEFLFNAPSGELKEEAFENLRHKNVFRYRVRTIVCGDVVEIEAFPIWVDYKNVNRVAKENSTPEAQAKVNERNAKKTLTRKINANFTKDDFHITLTYKDGYLPNEEQALKDMRNYIKRVRYHYKKLGLPPVKYVYVIEFSDGDGRRTRVHHHVIISGGMDRQALKDLWAHGRVRVDELEPEDGTLEGLARYITKQHSKTKQTKRWITSRNLKPYTRMTHADTKLSKRQAERLAEDVKTAAPQIFGKHYSDCILDSCVVKSSEFVAGAYIYAKMHKAQATDNRKG